MRSSLIVNMIVASTTLYKYLQKLLKHKHYSIIFISILRNMIHILHFKYLVYCPLSNDKWPDYIGCSKSAKCRKHSSYSLSNLRENDEIRTHKSKFITFVVVKYKNLLIIILYIFFFHHYLLLVKNIIKCKFNGNKLFHTQPIRNSVTN